MIVEDLVILGMFKTSATIRSRWIPIFEGMLRAGCGSENFTSLFCNILKEDYATKHSNINWTNFYTLWQEYYKTSAPILVGDNFEQHRDKFNNLLTSLINGKSN